MVTSFLGGFSPLRTVEDMGEGGVKKLGKSGDVLYGRPQIMQALHIIGINQMPSLNFLILVLMKTTILSLIWKTCLKNPIFQVCLLFIMYLKEQGT